MFGRRTQNGGSTGGDSAADPYAAAREDMIENQLRSRGVVMHSVLEAMRAIPRHLFVAHEFAARAYADEALPSIEGQTISQPFIVAVMSQELQIHPGQRILEIGTGTGYQSAILAHLVSGGATESDPTLGCIYTIERVAKLSHAAQRRLAAMDIRNIQFAVGDGSAGWPADGWNGERSVDGQPQFERIMVTAGAPEIPLPLVRQLKLHGVMVLPVGTTEAQTLVRVIRTPAGIQSTDLLPCRFVPLVGLHAWEASSPPPPPPA